MASAAHGCITRTADQGCKNWSQRGKMALHSDMCATRGVLIFPTGTNITAPRCLQARATQGLPLCLFPVYFNEILRGVFSNKMDKFKAQFT
jgi:hypothetical protein